MPHKNGVGATHEPQQKTALLSLALSSLGGGEGEDARLECSVEALHKLFVGSMRRILYI